MTDFKGVKETTDPKVNFTNQDKQNLFRVEPLLISLSTYTLRLANAICRANQLGGQFVFLNLDIII